jgi:chromatin remodeling complex protein RSC6
LCEGVGEKKSGHKTMTARDATEATMVKSEKTEQNTEEKREKKPSFEEPSYCLLCGMVGPALLYGHWVCEHCKNVVQAEAVSKKRKIEKEGGG